MGYEFERNIKLQTQTGVADDNLPISSSSCIIFLIRDYKRSSSKVIIQIKQDDRGIRNKFHSCMQTFVTKVSCTYYVLPAETLTGTSSDGQIKFHMNIKYVCIYLCMYQSST